MPEILTHGEPKPAVFPRLPVVLYLLIVGFTALILVIPPLVKQRELAASGQAPIWWGYSFYGQCLVTVEVIHPDGPRAAEFVGAVPPGSAVVLLRLDNRFGRSEITVHVAQQRFFLFGGRSIGSLPHPLADRNPRHCLEPGAPVYEYTCAFDRKQLLPYLDHLYALQLTINGETHNVQGQVYYDPKEYENIKRDYEGRVKFFQ